MKILLSAYACEPNKGSEPGVGWCWAHALRRLGYDVHVITRSNNRQSIEAEYDGSDPLLTFHYYDLPSWLRFWKHWLGGIYLYYLLWQIGAYRQAKSLHARLRFEQVHHITFVSYRQPSFMGGLNIPFLFGPVGGGESMPVQFRKSLPVPGMIAETIRDAGNRFVAFDPLMQRTYARAQTIACTTEETRAAIPAPFRNKCIVQRAIGIDNQVRSADAQFRNQQRSSKAQFLFVGRLLYWKGLHLALRALVAVRLAVPGVTLRVIGEGSDRRWLEQVAKTAKVLDIVEWISRKPHEEIRKEYRDSAAFIFPSLHDSGGMVVLEAMAEGLPVICLDLGGPGSIVTPESGFSLPVANLSESEVVERIAAAMIRVATDEELRGRLASGALRRAADLTWDAAAKAVYGTSGLNRMQEPFRAEG